MDLQADERSSESPLVERVWNSRTDQPGEFISIAANHSELVITKRQGSLRITFRGPETRATKAFAPDNAEFVGIMFRLGTFLPKLPIAALVDSSIDLPQATGQSFWLNGSVWEVPTFENADVFVNRLVHEELLVHDGIVDTLLQGEISKLSVRTTQRRFVQATGLTHTTVCQIERARYATMLLKQGNSIMDTVFEADYFDQPHLTRSLKHYIGQTPAQIMNEHRAERLSFLYHTTSHPPALVVQKTAIETFVT